MNILCPFFLRNYSTRISEIWFPGLYLYKSVILCDAFSDSSLNNFLFTNTYIFIHMKFKLKFFLNFVTFSEELHYKDFLKFGFRVYISQLHCTLCDVPDSSLSNFLFTQTLSYFYAIKIIHLRRGYY